MGMTDRQFDAYQENLLERLKDAQRENEEKGITNTALDRIIKTLENQLKRP